jgi:hypothetical protein
VLSIQEPFTVADQRRSSFCSAAFRMLSCNLCHFKLEKKPASLPSPKKAFTGSMQNMKDLQALDSKLVVSSFQFNIRDDLSHLTLIRKCCPPDIPVIVCKCIARRSPLTAHSCAVVTGHSTCLAYLLAFAASTKSYRRGDAQIRSCFRLIVSTTRRYGKRKRSSFENQHVLNESILVFAGFF